MVLLHDLSLFNLRVLLCYGISLGELNLADCGWQQHWLSKGRRHGHSNLAQPNDSVNIGLS